MEIQKKRVDEANLLPISEQLLHANVIYLLKDPCDQFYTGKKATLKEHIGKYKNSNYPVGY